jgi:hypothetical protein
MRRLYIIYGRPRPLAAKNELVDRINTSTSTRYEADRAKQKYLVMIEGLVY